MERKKGLFCLVCLLTMCLFAIISFIESPLTVAASEKLKVIKVGWLFDMTGPLANTSNLALLGAEDWFRYSNESGFTPGVKIEMEHYDTKYDPARTALGYKKLKNQGVICILGGYSQDAEVVKPICTRDKVPFISATGGETTLTPPGWVFVTLPRWLDAFNSLIVWVQDTWDYEKMGRNPRLCSLGWDNTLGTSHIKTSQEFAKKNNMKIDLGPFEVVPMMTMDFSTNVKRIKDADPDYIYLSMVSGPNASAIKQLLNESVRGKIMVMITGSSLSVISNVVGEERIQGLLKLTYYGWFTDDTPGMKLAMELQAKYHPDKSIAEDSYFWCYFGAMAITKAIGKIIKEKGTEAINRVTLYKALEEIEVDSQGLCGTIKFGKEKGPGIPRMRIQKLIGNTWVDESKWYPSPPVGQ